MTIQWNIQVSGTPEILRRCKGCGKKQLFASSGLFRINANQSRLDVWLIYRCTRCNATWNLDVHSRVPVRSLDKEEYRRYLENDLQLAQQCAFDRRILSANRAELFWDNLDIQVEGPAVSLETLEQPLTVQLNGAVDLDVRAERLIRQKLHISRSEFVRCCEVGRIAIGEGNGSKAKWYPGMKIQLFPRK